MSCQKAFILRPQVPCKVQTLGSMCGGLGLRSKSRTSLKIVFSVLFFTTMFRNHSYLHHRYSIRFALFLMTLDSMVYAQGGARGQDLGHVSAYTKLFLYPTLKRSFKGGILFSRCPSVRPSVPSVTLCFLNTLKPLSRNFMKPCTHIHIDGANIMIKHKGLGASSVRVISLCNS